MNREQRRRSSSDFRPLRRTAPSSGTLWWLMKQIGATSAWRTRVGLDGAGCFSLKSLPSGHLQWRSTMGCFCLIPGVLMVVVVGHKRVWRRKRMKRLMMMKVWSWSGEGWWCQKKMKKRNYGLYHAFLRYILIYFFPSFSLFFWQK